MEEGGDDEASARSCWMPCVFGAVPSRRRIWDWGMPTAAAAALAVGNEDGSVSRIFVSAVFRACIVSSRVYAGEAPLTRPPARIVAHTPTGYHIELPEKRLTVWPG